MKRDSIDFFLIPDAHLAIDARLCMWARWVKPGRSSGWIAHPMWKNYRSHAWQWHEPVIQLPMNTLQAHETEKAVAALPAKNRDAIRWNYVFRRDPAGMAQKLAVTRQGLLDLVSNGRTMLINRTKKD
jgi:hypothetical protein